MHPATEQLLKGFWKEPITAPEIRDVSQFYCDMAHHLVSMLPEGAETTVALRKLLESKDAAVRSVVFSA